MKVKVNNFDENKNSTNKINSEIKENEGKLNKSFSDEFIRKGFENEIDFIMRNIYSFIVSNSKQEFDFILKQIEYLLKFKKNSKEKFDDE